MPFVTPISSAPTMITPEEHAELIGSTPASFSDIPAVLRRKEQNTRLIFDPPVNGFTEQELSSGTLYVIESVLAFISTATGRGFEIKYPNIILHGVSRPQTGPYVYCQLGEAATGDDADEGDGDSEFQELQIFPDDTATLDELFKAISDCGSLHPDPQLEGSDMGDVDDDDAFIDPDVEAIQQLDGEEPVLTEGGRVRSDFVNSRYNPY